MVTVKVVSKSTGNPQQNQRVVLSVFDGVTKSEYTDSKGEAHFNISPQNGEIIVNGRTVEKGRLEGKMVVYI